MIMTKKSQDNDPDESKAEQHETGKKGKGKITKDEIFKEYKYQVYHYI